MFIAPQCGVDGEHSYNGDGSGPGMKHAVSMHFRCTFRVLGSELRDNIQVTPSGIKDFESSVCSSEPHTGARRMATRVTDSSQAWREGRAVSSGFPQAE